MLSFPVGPVIAGAILCQRTSRRRRARCALFCSWCLNFLKALRAVFYEGAFNATSDVPEARLETLRVAGASEGRTFPPPAQAGACPARPGPALLGSARLGRGPPACSGGKRRAAEAALLPAPPREPFPDPARTHRRRRGDSRPGLGSRLQAGGAFRGLRRSLAAPS